MDFVPVPKNMRSRVLYTNPVVLLGVGAAPPAVPRANFMTLSWLTPMDNNGNFLLSMNAMRTCAVSALAGRATSRQIGGKRSCRHGPNAARAHTWVCVSARGGAMRSAHRVVVCLQA
jgi:hypothetical protein